MMRLVKKGSVFVVLMVLLVLLAGCAKEPFTCFMCGEESEGKEYKGEMFGEEISLCESCYQGMNQLSEAMKNTLNQGK